MDENRRRIIKQNIIDELLTCLNANESLNIVYKGENNYLSGLISLLKPGSNYSKREFLIWYLTFLQIEKNPDIIVLLFNSYYNFFQAQQQFLKSS